MNMKITCLKCESEYIVDIAAKNVYCIDCDIDYLVTSVESFSQPDGTIRVVSKYESINSKYKFSGEQELYIQV